MRERSNRGRHDLVVDFDWQSRQWSATHRNYVDPLVAVDPPDAPGLGQRRPLIIRASEWVSRRLAVAAARKSFPNNLGNYAGKRKPAPAGKPLSPDERFRRLAAHYLSCRQTYRNPPLGKPRIKLPPPPASPSIREWLSDLFWKTLRRNAT